MSIYYCQCGAHSGSPQLLLDICILFRFDHYNSQPAQIVNTVYDCAAIVLNNFKKLPYLHSACMSTHAYMVSFLNYNSHACTQIITCVGQNKDKLCSWRADIKVCLST